MSGTTCSSCGAPNATGLVYCSSCGGILPSASQDTSSHSPSTVAVARRRHLRINADQHQPASLFSRLRGAFTYLLCVAAGVVLVLALMDDARMPSRPDASVPNARAVLDRIVQSARYSPSGISQAVANSLLSQQGALTFDSPIPPIPMPSWEATGVEFKQGVVTLKATVSVFGLALRMSETFRLRGTPLDWGLVPQSATVGLVPIPSVLLPAMSLVMRPAVMPYSKDLDALSKAASLSIRYGMVDFSLR